MQENILFGGYTRHDGQGIYRASLSTEQSHIDHPELYIKIDNPTYLTVTEQNILVTIAKEGDQGGLAAYDISTDQPHLLNKVLAVGAPPAYVSYDQKRQLIFAANYHKGQILVYRLSNEGLTLVATETHEGHGPLPEQDSAHVHYTDLTPDQRLVVCDLGTDEVSTYDVDDEGQLTLVKTFSTTPGFGPRHLVFNPNYSIAYLLGELSSKVQILAYEPALGQFTGLTTYDLIPEDYTEHNGSAAIRISHDGRFLYASNRGYNSLAVFKISADGLSLELIQQISSEGDFPRDFSLDSTENFLVCANQNSDNATLYKRDNETGRLTLLQKDIITPEAVCVYFA